MHLPPALRKCLPAAWSPECWSRQYARDRIRAWRYRRKHPDLPWLTADANALLIEHLSPESRVLEFGCGGSTLFFARNCREVISIEHDPAWHRRVTRQLAQENLTAKVDLRLLPPSSHAEAAAPIPAESLDLVLVDGVRRADCVLACMDKLKPRGLLVIDNINRHMPNDSPCPDSLRAWNKRDPAHIQWQNIHQQLAAWEQIWTSNGVTDTLLAWKP